MATFSDKIRLLFEVDDKGSFGKIKREIASADTAAGKLKSGVSGLGGVLKENLAGAAMAAGTALAVFAVKAVSAFQQLALESGKFADATGVNVEEASRLGEVAGDLDIELGTLQSALQKLNKAAADGVVDVEGFGNAIIRAEDGTVDAYQTFINAATAIGAIEDPSKRAQAAQEAFGRSYGEIAELMEMDAESLRAALDGVGDGKVISEEELEKAKAFREGMERIRDAVDEVTMAVGGAIAGNSALLETFADSLGTIAKYADEAMRVADAFLTVTNPLYGVNRIIGMVGNEMDLTTMSLEEMIARLESEGFTSDQIALFAEDWHRVNDAVTTTAGSVDGATASVERFLAVTDAANASTSRAASVASAHGTALGILQNKVDNYRNSVDKIDEEKLTEIQAAIDAGDIARAERLLNQVTRSRVVQVGIALNKGVVDSMAAANSGLGAALGADINKAFAAISSSSSVRAGTPGGGGGGGGGGGSSPAQQEVDTWAEAIARAYDYGEITRDEYRKYLADRLAGEEKYGDAYDKTWREIQALDKEAAAERAAAERDRLALEKKAADEAEKAAKDAAAAAKEATREIERSQQALGNLIINVTNTSADPQSVVRAIEQARRMFGNRWLTG